MSKLCRNIAFQVWWWISIGTPYHRKSYNIDVKFFDIIKFYWSSAKPNNELYWTQYTSTNLYSLVKPCDLNSKLISLSM